MTYLSYLLYHILYAKKYKENYINIFSEKMPTWKYKEENNLISHIPPIKSNSTVNQINWANNGLNNPTN